MALTRVRGIKQPHPLGSVASRSGISQLTAESGVVTSLGVKISALPVAGTASDTDQLEANQAGTTRRITLDQVATVVAAAIPPAAAVMADGTVALPGMPFASDLDTGFYRPASNQLSIALGGVNFLTASLTAATGGGPTLALAAGIKPTIAYATLAAGPTLTAPFDISTTVGQFDAGGTSDFRSIRNITGFNNTGTANADKVYCQYQGLTFAGSGTGTVGITYGYHGFTTISGATNVTTTRGLFHHHVLSGSGGIPSLAINYEAGTSSFTGTGAVGTMIGFQTSGIGHASLVSNVFCFQAGNTTAAGTVYAFHNEVSGAGNYSFHSTTNAAFYQGGLTTLGATLQLTGTQILLTQNQTMTRAVGTAAAGTGAAITYNTTFSGDPGGTTDMRGLHMSLTSSGSNAINATRLISGFIASGATATTAAVDGGLWLTQLTASGNVTSSNNHRASVRIDSTGGIGTHRHYLADAPVLGSTGAIATTEGFTANAIGHATLVTTARGFRMVDTSAATLVEGFTGELTSGTGKWNISMTGTADNRIAGNIRLGGSTAPTVALDVTGAAKISTTLGVTGTLTVGTSATAVSTWSASAGSYTNQVTRADSPTTYTILTYQNYGITAADQGHTTIYSYGTGGSAGGNAGTLDFLSTDTWAAAANRSAKFRIRVQQSGGGLTNALEATTTVLTIPGVTQAMSATAVGAGANTQAFVKASTTANLGVYYGTGDPTFSAAKGSLYSKTDATTTTTRLWVNTTGSTTWANFTASA